MKALLAIPYLRWILVGVFIALLSFLAWRSFSDKNMLRKNVKKLRKGGEANKVFVRRTDLLKLTPNQERDRKRALELVEKGNLLEGARLLESVNLHREAVNTLEEAGLVEEACEILIRIQRPNRAAALYARHGMHIKAAEYFLAAKCPADAATQYLEAAKSDPSCFERAGRIFEAIPKLDEALKAYTLGRVPERVVSLSFQMGSWLDLLEFMSDRSNAKMAFACMDAERVRQFVEKVPVDQRSVQLLAMWSDLHRKTDFLAGVLRKLTKHRAPLSGYWQALPADLAGQLCAALAKSVDPKSKEGTIFLMRNATALLEAKHYGLAAEIYTRAERYAMAGKCYALAGQLLKSGEILRLTQDESLVKRFDDAMQASAAFQSRAEPGKFHPETIATVCRALDNIDPDYDDAEVRSPFSMAAA